MNDNMSGSFDFTARVPELCELCELSDDYTLPDYMPAIGRVIACTATVSLPSMYLGGGNLEFAGGVRYRLHYEAAEDSALWCAELPGEYDILIPSDRISELSIDPTELSGISHAEAENVSARITAPRRLTLRSRIRLCASLCRRSHFDAAFRGDIGETEAIRRLEATAACGILASGLSAPIVCKDRIPLSEAGLYDGSSFRIISSHGSPMLTRLEQVDSIIHCRGDLCISLLIASESDGERPRRITRKLPFSAELRPDVELSDSLGIRALGVCPSVSATADDDGISIEATILITAEAAASTRVRYLKDIYSQKAEAETAYAALTLHSPIACFNGNMTVSASAPVADIGMDAGMRAVDCRARVLPELSSEIGEGGKLTVSGRIKTTVLADNGAEMTSAEFDSDFKYTCDLSCSPASPTISVIASIAETKCRIDNGRLESDSELCLAVRVEESCPIRAVSEVNMTRLAAEKSSAANMIVYYPAKGESLWDIAKKYHTDALELAEKNALNMTAPDAPDVLARTAFIII